MLHVPTNTPLKRQLFVLLVIFQLLVHLLSFLSLIKIYLMENIAGEESSCQNSDLFDFKDTNVSCFLVNIAYQIAKFKVCARKNHSLIFAYFAYCAMPPTYPNFPSQLPYYCMRTKGRHNLFWKNEFYQCYLLLKCLKVYTRYNMSFVRQITVCNYCTV